MKKDDLLIVDIGRSFLFSSRLKFIPEKGYVNREHKFSRYPKYEEVDTVINKFLAEYDQAEGSKRFYLVEDGDSHRKLKGETSKKNLLLYNKHLTNLESELDIEGLAVLNIDKDLISKINSKSEKFREIDFLDLEIFKDNLKILTELGVTTDDLINYFLSDHPLPQQVSDHHKSFIISYIIGTIIGSSFDFKDDRYIIILSEWFKSGFLDRSGFIYGFGKISGIENYSFDSSGIWKLILNEGKEEFSEIQYLNRKVFFPEFYTTTVVDKREIRIVDKNDNVVDYKIDAHVQGYIQGYMDGSLSSQLSNTGGDIFLNINDLSIRNIKNVDNFKSWYRFYKYEFGDYSSLSYEDKYNHIVEVEADFDNDLKMFKEKDIHFHDFSKLQPIGRENFLVSEGQTVNVNDILVEKTIIGGTFAKRVRSRVDGIVQSVDIDNSSIEIKSDEKFSYLKNFDYEILERTSRNKVRIKVQGFRVNAAFFTQDNSSFGFLNLFSGNFSPDRYNIYWFAEVKDFREMLKNTDPGMIPRAIILPSITYKEFVELANKYSKTISNFQLVILNGFGNRPYTSSQIKLFKVCDQKSLLLDPSEDSIYIFEKKAKFNSSRPPVTFQNFSKVYTFDDWNLTGEVIYNDEDSKIFRSYDSLVIDIADFNLIDFNKIN